MELVATLSFRAHQTSGLENVEMLRDRLPGRPEAVLGCEPSAQLEQGLPVAFGEFVEDRTPCGIGECLEDVSHTDATIGKYRLACQSVDQSVQPASTLV
ncbi:MAG TPA: hypothetical protein VE623_24440 [Acidimicrobiales bacterium]|jgi:hypothetical protein|nr:hypothetical protein [Acidimicrobiales bacterium]